MGRKCFVPICNSGYASCKENVITFKVPSDPVRLQVWARAFPRKDRELTSHDYVWEKHFSESDIERRRYYGELGGEVLLDKPKRPVLSPDAVPSIFPNCPNYLSSVRKKRKPARPVVTCAKHANTESLVVQDANVHAPGDGEDNEAVRPVNSYVVHEPAVGSAIASASNCGETSSGICGVVTNDRLCAVTSGVADVHPQIETPKLKSPEMFLLDKLVGVQEIVMPSVVWSRRDIVEEAVSICFVEMKKPSPTTP
ncbi:hypothetical protein HPB48_010983 [Haemaphysalis longicornis]|uniref:THAP-type domain-containing protein n=1 Tax=Haemaphysalis longicornis TaxID=44386 RepID=A0A9J6GDG1_HAELO|nr:hypothetical protein HPB48_010983 [Haemaphysalis longicornis]